MHADVPRRQWSLRHNLRLAAFAALTLIAAYLIIYHVLSSSYAKRQVLETHTRRIGQAQIRMTDLLGDLDATVKRALYSRSVQAALFTSKPLEYLQNRESAINFFDNASRANSAITDFYLHRFDRYAVYHHADWAARNRYQRIVKMHPAMMNGQSFKPFFLTNSYIPMNAPQEERLELLYCLPINNARYTYANEPRTAVGIIQINPSAFFVNLWEERYVGEVAALMFSGSVVQLYGDAAPSHLAAIEAIAANGAPPRGVMYVGQEDTLANVIPLADTDWAIITLVPGKTLLAPLMRIRNMLLMGIFPAMLLLFVLFEVNFYHIFQQIREMETGASMLRETETELLPFPALTELQPMVFRFNDAVRALRDAHENERRMAHALMESSLAQNQAMLSAYRNQITPHFLFNTMEAMRSMAHQARASALESLIRATSLFLRYTLRSSQYVYLREELRYIQVYCDILNVRFPDRVDLRIHAREDAMEMQILSTVLQPLVENSVSHGCKDKRLTLAIHARSVSRGGGSWLLLRVADNGKGIAREKLAELRQSMKAQIPEDTRTQVGLRNIYHRLLLRFGSSFEMDVQSREGCYTLVRLELPQKGAGFELASGKDWLAERIVEWNEADAAFTRNDSGDA
jgi:two-component system sensor histidine kinase YesM